MAVVVERKEGEKGSARKKPPSKVAKNNNMKEARGPLKKRNNFGFVDRSSPGKGSIKKKKT